MEERYMSNGETVMPIIKAYKTSGNKVEFSSIKELNSKINSENAS
jgi:hypothetical protein